MHIGSNPPEDRAILARNLGIWCVALGTLAVIRSLVSPLAAIAGLVALYNGITFHRDNGRLGGSLPGSTKATIGIVLSAIGLIELLAVVVLRFALAR